MTDNFHESIRFHYKYIDVAWNLLFGLSQKQFALYGRGALSSDAQYLIGDSPNFMYVPAHGSHFDRTLQDNIKSYNPNTEIVFLIRLSNGEVRVYRLNQEEAHTQACRYWSNFPYYEDFPELLDFVKQLVIECLPPKLDNKQNWFDEIHLLALKIQFSATTLYRLVENPALSVYNPLTGEPCVDFGTVQALCRIAHETFLKMYEVFLEFPSNSEEAHRRYLSWVLDGFKLWERVAVTSELSEEQKTKLREKKSNAEKSIRQLKNEISKLPVSKAQIPKREAKTKNAGLGEGYINVVYAQANGHIHSDRLAVASAVMKEMDDLSLEIDWIIWIIASLLSRLVLEYKRLFPNAQVLCDLQENQHIFEVIERINEEVAKAKA